MLMKRAFIVFLISFFVVSWLCYSKYLHLTGEDLTKGEMNILSSKPTSQAVIINSEEVYSTIERFEKIYEKNRELIEQSVKNKDIFIVSDTEGKFFNIYSVLRTSGLIKPYDSEKKPKIFYNTQNNAFEDESKGDKSFSIPLFEINEHCKNKLIHCGDICDKGKNSIPCLLVLLYVKKILKDNVILIIGNHELFYYGSYRDEASKQPIVFNAIKNNLMKFFGRIRIGNTSFLLTHKEVVEEDFTGIKKAINGDDILLFNDYVKNVINEVYKEGKCFYKHKEIKELEVCYDNPGDLLNNKIIPYTHETSLNNQICGHIHHRVEHLVKGAIEHGCYFENKNILYVDNYSTDKYNDGSSGASQVHIHTFNSDEEVKQDTVLRITDRKENSVSSLKIMSS